MFAAEPSSRLCSKVQASFEKTCTNAAALCREADQDGDQVISLDEFVRLVQLNKADNLSNFGDRRRRML
jgi:hypothetical protein